MALYKSIALLLLLCTSIVIAAQDDTCPALIQQALDYVDSVCSATDRNQACYGNLQVEAIPADPGVRFIFNAPGDIVSLTQVQTFNVSQMSTPDQWGVALLQVQANLPDTLPGQNVTMLLLGDLQVTNQGEIKPIQLEISTTNNVNLRSGPGTGYRTVGVFQAGETALADGRDSTGDWLRVILPDESVAWVNASVINPVSDVDLLAVVAVGFTESGVQYGPMQAFYFQSGIGDAKCVQAPPDGILIQTPDGETEIELLVNEVRIQLGSTAFLRAQPGGFLTIDMLDGLAIVATDAGVVAAPAGTRALVPLDANGIANGAPFLEGYEDDQARLEVVPTTSLPAAISVPQSLTGQALSDAQNAVIPGLWVAEDVSYRCGNRSVTAREGLTIAYQEFPPAGTATTESVSYTRELINPSTDEPGGTEQGTFTFNVISPILIEAVYTYSTEYENNTCSGTYTLTYRYQG